MSGALTYVSGNGQTGGLNAALAQPLVVKVTSSNGSPVTGAPVSFAVTTGTGRVSSAVAATASDGTASTSLTLGSTEGNVAVTASVAGISANVTFGASATPGFGILPGGIVNAASYGATPVSPGSLVAIFTSALPAQAASLSTASLPSSLGGVSVTFNGVTAPIVQVAPTGAYPFVSAQVPFEALGVAPISATVPVVVSVNGIPSAPVQTQIQSSPGIFTLNSEGTGQAVLVNLADYSIAGPSGTIPGAHPIPRGQSAFFYVTGLGTMAPSVADGSGMCPAENGVRNANTMPTVLVGGVQAQVAFAGQAPGFPGVSQINLTIPAATPTGNTVFLVVKSADGTVTSNATTIAVQ